MAQDFRFPHSADVSMWLDCGSYGRVELSRITPTSVVARNPRPVPTGDADLVVVVDGREMRNRVHLAKGFSKKGMALILAVDDVAPF